MDIKNLRGFIAQAVNATYNTTSWYKKIPKAFLNASKNVKSVNGTMPNIFDKIVSKATNALNQTFSNSTCANTLFARAHAFAQGYLPESMLNAQTAAISLIALGIMGFVLLRRHKSSAERRTDNAVEELDKAKNAAVIPKQIEKLDLDSVKPPLHLKPACIAQSNPVEPLRRRLSPAEIQGIILSNSQSYKMFLYYASNQMAMPSTPITTARFRFSVYYKGNPIASGPEVIQALTRAADGGDLKAMCSLLLRYRDGYGVYANPGIEDYWRQRIVNYKPKE